MKNFILLTAIAVGAATFSVQDTPDISADLAIAASLDQFREESPAGDVCENCLGTGKIGDGVVVFDCPVCGGDGKPR